MTGVVTFMVGNAQTSCNLIVSPLEITSRITDVNSSCKGRAIIEVEFTHEIDLNNEGVWYHNEQAINKSDKRYEFVNEGRWNKLVIAQCQKSDAGLYSLKIDAAGIEYTSELFVADEEAVKVPSPVESYEEELGMMQSPVSQTDQQLVQEEVKKEIEISTISEEVLTIQETGEVTIEFETNEEGLYGTWYKNGQQIDEQSSEHVTYVVHARRHKLLFKEVSFEDSGDYSFAVGNVVNTCTLNIIAKEIPKCAPIFTQELCSCVVISGEQIALTCRVRGEPQPDISWLKPNGQMIISDNVKYAINSDGEEQHTLIIGNADGNDAGFYTAVAKNEIGRVSSKAEVIIDEKSQEIAQHHDSPPPTPAPVAATRIEIKEGLKDFTTREGNSALFTCKVAGSGFTGTWFHNNKKVIPSRFFKISEYQGLHQLEILETFPEDVGQYRFIAQGEMNECSSAATLAVETVFQDKNTQAIQQTDAATNPMTPPPKSATPQPKKLAPSPIPQKSKSPQPKVESPLAKKTPSPTPQQQPEQQAPQKIMIKKSKKNSSTTRATTRRVC
jgi:hypothetical protein